MCSILSLRSLEAVIPGRKHKGFMRNFLSIQQPQVVNIKSSISMHLRRSKAKVAWWLPCDSGLLDLCQVVVLSLGLLPFPPDMDALMCSLLIQVHKVTNLSLNSYNNLFMYLKFMHNFIL